MKIKSKIFIIAFSLLILSIAFCIGISAAAIIPGDMNGDSDVNVDDAIYLLRYTFKPEDYPLSQSADVNGDGTPGVDDAIYLLRHTFKPEDYPILNGSDIQYSEGLEFTSNGDGTCYVSGIGSCTDTDLVIPPTSPAGDSVTSIGNEAFGLCKFTSVVIPNSVTGIGDMAFNLCTGLTSIVIPDNVKRIGNGAFWLCTNLTSAFIGDSVTSIGEGVFCDCKSIISITVSEDNTTYKSIDGNLYTKDGTTLIRYAIGKTDTEFAIPDGVTSIENSAFSGCSGLTSIVVPNSVISIGSSAFEYCYSLTSVVIGDGVTNIEHGAFALCFVLNNITVTEDNANYKSINGNLYSKDGKTLVQYAIGKTDTEFTIPDGVTSIGNEAFYRCTNLTSIVIPDSTTSIGEMSFSCCFNLASVIIGDSVISIKNFAFSGCDSLISIVIPKRVTIIEYCAFSGCSNLADVYYTGSEETWADITIGNYNDELKNATIVYNYSE